MARNEKKRQKSIQHKSAKRKERKRAIAHSLVKSYRNEIKAASLWPLHECLISKNWNAEGEIVQILLARQSPTTGEVGVSSFLVDLGCLGVKDAFTRVFYSKEEYEQGLRANFMLRAPFVPCTPDLVAKVLREGIAYGRTLGFKPHPDYYDAALLVGGDPDASEETIPLGKDGKPFFVAGPFDNPLHVISKLDKAVGPGNYEYVAFLDEAPGFFGDEDDEYEDEDFDPLEFLPFGAIEDTPRRQVKVDLEQVGAAIADVSDNLNCLDIETSSIVTVPSDVDAQLDLVYQSMTWDDTDEEAQFVEILQSLDIPEAMKQAVIEANRIDSEIGERYIPIDSYWTFEGYQDMAAFAATVTDRKLRDRLQRAIQKDDFLSEFQQELERSPEEKERWSRFSKDRRQQGALDFLSNWGIEPILDAAWIDAETSAYLDQRLAGPDVTVNYGPNHSYLAVIDTSRSIPLEG